MSVECKRKLIDAIFRSLEGLAAAHVISCAWRRKQSSASTLVQFNCFISSMMPVVPQELSYAPRRGEVGNAVCSSAEKYSLLHVPKSFSAS